MDFQNKKRKETSVPTTQCQSSSNPSQAFRPGSSRARSPSLSGSRGFVTMQLTGVLIRGVWLWELRTYGLSKDIYCGFGESPQCQEANPVMGDEKWFSYVFSYRKESGYSLQLFVIQLLLFLRTILWWWVMFFTFLSVRNFSTYLV